MELVSRIAVYDGSALSSFLLFKAGVMSLLGGDAKLLQMSQLGAFAARATSALTSRQRRLDALRVGCVLFVVFLICFYLTY
jgi:hypothetical protein